MSVEKAEEFIKRLKQDNEFRRTIAHIHEPGAIRTVLVCEQLIFSEQELIDAVIADIYNREQAIAWVARGWKFTAK